MGAVALVVHRVIVVIDDIVAVMREGRTPVPKMVRQVKMVVVDTGIDNRHHDAFAAIS